MLHLDGAVSALAWDQAGERLIAGTDRGDLWELADGRLRPIAPAPDARHRGAVVSLTTDPTAGLIASADTAGTVVLHQALAATVDLGSRARSVSWSPRYGLLALVSQRAGLIVVDRAGTRVASLPPSRSLRIAAWTDHGAAPLVVGGAGGLRWIDPADPDLVRRHDRAPGAVLALAASGGPVDAAAHRWVAAGDLRGEVRLTSARTAEEVSIAGWPDPVAHLAWLADGRRVVVVGGDEATVWSVEPPDDDEREPPRAATPRGPISALAAHPWLPLVALGSEAGDVVWWDVDAERTIDALDVGSPVTAIAWDGLGERTHIATRAGRIWSRPVG